MKNARTQVFLPKSVLSARSTFSPKTKLGANLLSLPVILGVVLSSHTQVFADAKGEVSGTTVNVRTEPNTDSAIHTKLTKGEEVNIIGLKEDFYQINFDGNTDLYIASEFVNLVTGQAVLIADNVNIRTGPSTDHEILGKAAKDQAFNAIGSDGDFYAIEYNNQAAYIHKDYISITDYVPKEASAEQENVVQDEIATEEVQNETSTEEVQNENVTEETETTQDNSEIPPQVPIPEENTSIPQETFRATSDLYAVAASEGLRLRELPDLDAEVMATLPKGFSMTVLAESESWFKVSANGTEGYVSSEFAYLQTEPQAQYVDVPDVNLSLAQTIINYGMQYLGTPYVYGGTNLETGVDCSGFVFCVMNDYGVQLSRNSKTLLSDGVEISKSQLQPGDLVFFSTDNSASKNNIAHVGIYIADGNFIHSSSSSKTWGVTISSLNEDYYIRNYVSACRVL